MTSSVTTPQSPRNQEIITTPPTPQPLTSPKTTYFAQQPSLVEVTTDDNQAKALGATYYFTINLPEGAGTSLQQITINQREGAEYIRFRLKETVAFKGGRSQTREKLQLKDISSDRKTQTISFTFDPPVSPGTKITISLKAQQNPQRGGVYLFGVTASPIGEKPHSQFLGFGRLQFYQHI
ncbi:MULTISPECIES: DUF2808 domain-containing protein [Nostocales]|uniref:DUF2808 domain-containing protein n=1 Tax=Nostocales TaxID=1161 RepID=UPI0037C00F48